MKRIFIFLLLLFSFIFNAEAKFKCPKAPKPKLNFSMKKTRTKFDFSKDVQTLSMENPSKLGAGWLNEGIMSTKFPNYRIMAKIKSVDYPSINKACYWLEEVDFLWVFSPTINVAKNYKKGSCKYNTIITHERQHVSIDIQILTKWKNTIQRALNMILSKPMATGLVNRRRDVDFLPDIERRLKPFIDKMVKERNYRQGQIDTVEEYKRLANKCR